MLYSYIICNNIISQIFLKVAEDTGVDAEISSKVTPTCYRDKQYNA